MTNRQTGHRTSTGIPEFPLRQSCPSGFTRDDLKHIFSPSALREFNYWISGQTCMICNGKRYHYLRAHGSFCALKHTPEDADEYIWACDYVAGGWYEATACSGLPEGTRLNGEEKLSGHGPVAYKFDVERFIEGGRAKDLFD